MKLPALAQVVIIGGGFGGLYAAKALKGEAIDLTLVDRRNHHLFQPLLYQVATAALSPGDIAYPIRAILRKQKNAHVFLAEAVAVDLEKKEVVLTDGRLEYDYLILATGARHAYFGHEDWERSAPGLKSLEDALEIRRRILLAFERAERATDSRHRSALLTFVVVGGGPTGVELAGAIAEISRQVLIRDFRSIDPRDAKVYLVEAGSRLLSGFPEPLSEAAASSLQKLGVEVLNSTRVTGMMPGEVQIGDKKIEAETILWSAGVTASSLAQSLGVPRDRAGRVLVEPDLSIPGHPEVFVIGDLAAYTHQTGHPLPGTCPVAIQQGRHAAMNIRRKIHGQSTQPFHYLNRGNLATIGRAHAVADLGKLRLSGFPAWMAWLFVHIFFLIGFRNRFIVLFEWAWAYFTFQRGARLITGDLDKPRIS
ncbi:MAG: NAD(P)/FAD-dependent oxidoreductase [Terriglobia bacterium]